MAPDGTPAQSLVPENGDPSPITGHHDIQYSATDASRPRPRAETLYILFVYQMNPPVGDAFGEAIITYEPAERPAGHLRVDHYPILVLSVSGWVPGKTAVWRRLRPLSARADNRPRGVAVVVWV